MAAERGHAVTLYERENDLGGFMNLAMRIKGPHERIIDHKNYLIRQLELQSVTVITGKEVDADFIEAEAPDCIVVAVSGKPKDAVVQGNPNVVSLRDWFSYGFNTDDLPVGDNVVVYGAQLLGGDVAIEMVHAGKKVTLINTKRNADGRRRANYRRGSRHFQRNGGSWQRTGRAIRRAN